MTFITNGPKFWNGLPSEVSLFPKIVSNDFKILNCFNIAFTGVVYSEVCRT